jgi:hypothetical protein
MQRLVGLGGRYAELTDSAYVQLITVTALSPVTLRHFAIGARGSAEAMRELRKDRPRRAELRPEERGSSHSLGGLAVQDGSHGGRLLGEPDRVASVPRDRPPISLVGRENWTVTCNLRGTVILTQNPP